MRFVIFFAVLLGLLGLINGYVYWRAVRAFGWGKVGRRRWAGLLAVGIVATVLARFLAPLGDLAVALVGGVGATILIGSMVAFGVLAVDGVVRGLFFVASRIRRPRDGRQGMAPKDATPEETNPEGRVGDVATQAPADASLAAASEPPPSPGAAPPVAPAALTRRSLLERATVTGALGLGGSTALYGAVLGRSDYTVEEVPIHLERLPSALDGYTITQLSDLHVGLFIGDDELSAALGLVRETRPDAIVLTGDLIDNDVAYGPTLARFLRRLSEVAPTYAIPGNHDHYAGVGATLRYAREAGARVLFNHHERIAEGKIVLAGVDDVWARRRGQGGPDLRRTLYGAPPDAPRILLSHNPVFFPEASDEVDLQLSGHTHGGQFNPGVRPAELVLPFGYVAGRYERDGAQLYVNRGFGTTGPPSRLGSAPEITKLVLTS
ncbi:MAG: metallophosphoesterase [Myxococcota bacterium]